MRGSCLIRFSDDFVDRTLHLTSWWSIPDSGAIDAGFIQPPIHMAATDAWRNSSVSLEKFIERSRKDSDLHKSVLARRPLVGNIANDLEEIGINVPDASETHPCWWFYEVAVANWREKLRVSDVKSIYLPRTLLPFVQRALPSLNHRQFRVLNQFLGLESIKIPEL